ncbi:MAG: phosphoribosylformylglycinamidine cyclo-ligase [Lentisphaerae bacterium]|nr:phosphoribosylformylglycinamidine cyclo-ligase [Lentisphaerota bacterium]
MKKKSSYARAGVNIDEKMTGLNAIKKMVKQTSIQGVLNSIGSFGGIFESPGKEFALVASADGVGTKLKVAAMTARHNSVGQDLVNHCVNDILTQGATPLFFLDYIGTAKLKSDIFRDIVSGLCKACKQNGCALIGGETAEMPGLYPRDEYDLVGTIIGAVPKRRIITGETIRPGDLIIGLAANGLHTNGYSLARHVIFDMAKLKVNDKFPGTKRSVADVLLDIHRSYLRAVKPLLAKVPIQGMAHITGGGLLDNIPRILPSETRAVIDCSSWRVPNLFRFIQQNGKVDEREMYRVFNMGIGFVLFVREKDAVNALAALKPYRCGATLIGKVETGSRRVVLVN